MQLDSRLKGSGTLGRSWRLGLSSDLAAESAEQLGLGSEDVANVVSRLITTVLVEVMEEWTHSCATLPWQSVGRPDSMGRGNMSYISASNTM